MMKTYPHKNLHTNTDSSIIHNTLKEEATQCPLTKKQVSKCVQTTECYLAIKKNEVLTNVVTWMYLKDIMLNQTNLSQKTTYIVPRIWNVQNRQVIETESRLVSAQRMRREAVERECLWYKFSFGDDENILILDYGEGNTGR